MNVNLLRAKMAEHELTQEKVAALIKMSPNSLSRKLTGKREFRLSEVAALCEALQIENPNEIFLAGNSQRRNGAS